MMESHSFIIDTAALWLDQNKSRSPVGTPEDEWRAAGSVSLSANQSTALHL